MREERRVHTRIQIQCPVEILGQSFTFTPMMEEVSCGGARITLRDESRFAAGEKVQVAFRLPGASPIAPVATVVWCGHLHVGLYFHQPLPETVVTALRQLQHRVGDDGGPDPASEVVRMGAGDPTTGLLPLADHQSIRESFGGGAAAHAVATLVQVLRPFGRDDRHRMLRWVEQRLSGAL